LIPKVLLQELSRTHAIYSLTPAPRTDPLAESFYFQPQGLVYQLKPYRVDRALADPTPPEVIHDDETFWRDFETRQLPGLNGRINPPQPAPTFSFFQRLLNSLRFWPEADHESMIAGTFFASAMNDWGVELQQAGRFAEAKTCFDEALELNPLNAAAQVNQRFNADYLANRQEVMKQGLETAQSLNEFRDWRHVVRDGAVDDPNFCHLLGVILAENQLVRPAIAQFQRVRELSPSRLDTYVTLGRLFALCGDYTNLLVAAHELLAISPGNPDALLMKADAETGLKDYSAAISSLDQALAASPGSDLARLLKASVYATLKDYPKAIDLLDQVLANDPKNTKARLNRGAARRQIGQLAGAWSDFSAVIQTATNSYPAYLNLAELADQETNQAAAITNYALFLKYAPPNVREIGPVEARLRALQSVAP
jgi:tetratricopeptide (TPR) repeat protein